MNRNDISVGDQLKIESTNATKALHRDPHPGIIGTVITVSKVRSEGYQIFDEKGRVWAFEDLGPTDHIRCTATLKPL